MHIDKKLIAIALGSAVIGGIIGGTVGGVVGSHFGKNREGRGSFRMMGGNQRMMGGNYRSYDNGSSVPSQTGQAELNTSTTTGR